MYNAYSEYVVYLFTFSRFNNFDIMKTAKRFFFFYFVVHNTVSMSMSVTILMLNTAKTSGLIFDFITTNDIFSQPVDILTGHVFLWY